MWISTGLKQNQHVLFVLLAHCSNLDHLGIPIETDSYKEAVVFLLEVVYGFLFYTQHIHNDKEECNILCSISQC